MTAYVLKLKISKISGDLKALKALTVEFTIKYISSEFWKGANNGTFLKKSHFDSR